MTVYQVRGIILFMKEYKINEMKNIRLLGRNGKTQDGAAVLFWAAAAIEVNVKASEVWAHISADYDNLFSIGKAIGADFKSQAALRIQKSCISMGEAISKHIKKLVS